MSFINISHDQALDLELKLNLTEFSDEWSQLGDFLYQARLNPKLFNVTNLTYKVNNDQLEWIKENIILTESDKPYKLYI